MSAFEPNWMSPPGATVLDLLLERKVAVKELALSARRDVHSLSRLIFGLEPLTVEWAECLSSFLGASKEFWLRRERMYRDDLRRLCGPASEGLACEWLADVPLRDLVNFGWIEQGASHDETVLNACAFFGIATSHSFDKKYAKVLSASMYRASDAYVTRPTAVAAWLRQGEIEAAAVDCATWNPIRLHESLDSIRQLTREVDPSIFLPELKRVLSESGVAMVVARTPNGCRASGATRFLHSDKALIQLSFRYLADDQFWFTVFHEIGHLLLHSNDRIFLEGLEGEYADVESEANDFALRTLFAKVGIEALDGLEITKYAIARLAQRAGVSPGIVVGQLQERGRVPYKHFNYMKARYAWAD